MIDSTEVVCVCIQCSGCYSKELTCALFSVTSRGGTAVFDLLITGRKASGFR